MIIEELFHYREELLGQAADDNGFIQENLILSQVLPSMSDAKLIESEDFNNAYFNSKVDKIKVNAYCVNESGERLQLFIIDEKSIDLCSVQDKLMISKKSHYESQFKRCRNFINKAIKRYLNDEIQDSSPVRPLVSKISSSEGLHQFDVIEIFVISTTATVSLQGAQPTPKKIDFDDDIINVTYTKNRENIKKDIIIKKRLIDLNFLYNVLISKGNREPLLVDFNKLFKSPLTAIKAADEENFESYLCVLPASILSTLYKDFSTRLLEKNVRSFLQFKGVNKGIRETIRIEPEKFVAYNNGLTITATSAEITNIDNQIKINSLTDFQIVNGGQTTATIYFTKKDGFDISKVKVMAKINVAKETTSEELEELISNISTYSNAQSRVSKVDLRSRNPQLVKIKSLSESIMTPSGNKWFFERAKGEFNTKARIAGKNKASLAKEFPTERRFSKELMAKYYCAWGDQPHLVKKGGEKIFRYFIEELTGEGDFKKTLNVNRDFYEELISKIILFRKLEKIYGSGKNSMGQLRSAVVPYTISILYSITDGNKKGDSFDLIKIWLSEKLNEDLDAYLKSLLVLVNTLIKKYSASDDYGEYSKKIELWSSIIKSPEIKEFSLSSNTESIIKKYGISKNKLKKRKGEVDMLVEVDFKSIIENTRIYTLGPNYYKKITNDLEILTPTEERHIENILSFLANKKDVDEKLIISEQNLTDKIRAECPSFFDTIQTEDSLLNETLNFIILTYNKAISNGSSIYSEFERIEKIANAKGVKYSSTYSEIGKGLAEGTSPTIKHVIYASYFLQKDNKTSSKPEQNGDIKIEEKILRKMVEWDSKMKTLSVKQNSYIADFAYGLQKITPYHEKVLIKYLSKLKVNGFKK